MNPPPIPAGPPRIHIAASTHTTRHLAACLCALARQSTAPATVALSCDTDDPAIAAELDRWWPRIARAMADAGLKPPPLIHTFRPHQGRPWPAQVRNNAYRALEQDGRLPDADLILGLDADMVLAEPALQRHAELAGAGAEVIIPFRVNLTPEQTEALAPETILDPDGPSLESMVGPDERRKLDKRHRRYEFQLALRRGAMGLAGRLVKPHKPKIISAHYAVTVRALRAINGFDEGYTDYGYEDDDLTRRLHALSPPPRTAIAVRDIHALHLWHPTRAPRSPTDAPGYRRFKRRDLPVFAERGWASPAPQPEPSTRIVPAGK